MERSRREVESRRKGEREGRKETGDRRKEKRGRERGSIDKEQQGSKGESGVGSRESRVRELRVEKQDKKSRPVKTPEPQTPIMIQGWRRQKSGESKDLLA